MIYIQNIIIKYIDGNHGSTANPQLSTKHLVLSPAHTIMTPKTQQQPSSPPRLSPILKIEGQSKFLLRKWNYF